MCQQLLWSPTPLTIHSHNKIDEMILQRRITRPHLIHLQPFIMNNIKYSFMNGSDLSTDLFMSTTVIDGDQEYSESLRSVNARICLRKTNLYIVMVGQTTACQYYGNLIPLRLRLTRFYCSTYTEHAHTTQTWLDASHIICNILEN